jgi:hypothetical protein
LKLMNGKAPVAIPITLKNTKLPSVAEKIKNLVTSREEALAAHELAVRILLQTGPESEMDAPSSKRTWLQRMCCALITPDVLICRKRKERFS